MDSPSSVRYTLVSSKQSLSRQQSRTRCVSIQTAPLESKDGPQDEFLLSCIIKSPCFTHRCNTYCKAGKTVTFITFYAVNQIKTQQKTENLTIFRFLNKDIKTLNDTEKVEDLLTKYIKKLNNHLRKEFKKIECVHINSPEDALVSTLNISLINKDTKNIISKLGEHEIFLSTTTACSLDSLPSKSVFAITGDTELSKNSIRISLSKFTTTKDLDKFLEIFKKSIDED